MREKVIRKIQSIVPVDVFLPLLFGFMYNNLIYWGCNEIAGKWHHYNMTLPVDEKIPFVPEWVFIYFGCYLFWGINYILIARQGKEEAFRFFTADILSRTVCAVFFILLPTTNIRPAIEENGVSDLLMKFLYWVDEPANLFPSIHCLVSWFCYIGIRGRKNISVWYRGFSCIAAILVFISTLTTKQHVIVDVAAGVLLAEGSYMVARKTNWYQLYMVFFDSITEKVFGVRIKKEGCCEQ